MFDLIGNLIPFILILIFIILEFIKPQRKLSFIKQGFWMDLIWYMHIQAIILQYTILIGIHMLFSNFHLNLITDFPIYLQLIIIIFIKELAAYFWHRLTHNFHPLWSLHKVHHSSTELNWVSTYRLHFMEEIIFAIIAGVILSSMGGSRLTLMIFPVFENIMGQYIHSNFKFKLGIFKYIFNSPQMHHVHHSSKTEHYNCNYGDKLSIFDWLFGTAKIISDKDFDNLEYGLNHDYPQSFIKQIYYPFLHKRKKKLEK